VVLSRARRAHAWAPGGTLCPQLGARTRVHTTHSARRCNMLPSFCAVAADAGQPGYAMGCGARPGPLLDAHVNGGGSARQTQSLSRAAGSPALLPPVTLTPRTVQARRLLCSSTGQRRATAAHGGLGATSGVAARWAPPVAPWASCASGLPLLSQDKTSSYKTSSYILVPGFVLWCGAREYKYYSPRFRAGCTLDTCLATLVARCTPFLLSCGCPPEAEGRASRVSVCV